MNFDIQDLSGTFSTFDVVAALLLSFVLSSAIGWVYRSRTGVKPLYLSPGHRVGLETGLRFLRALPYRTKLPEPLREAHGWAGRARKEGLRGRLLP